MPVNNELECTNCHAKGFYPHCQQCQLKGNNNVKFRIIMLAAFTVEIFLLIRILGIA